MKSCLKFVISHPLITLILLAISTALLAPGVGKLTFNNRLEAFMPKGDIDYIENQKAKEIYGDNSRYFVIAVSHPELKGELFFSLFETFIRDLEAYESWPGDHLNVAYQHLKVLAASSISHNALIQNFKGTPVFQRLLIRKLRHLKDPIAGGEVKALLSTMRHSLNLMATEPVGRVVSPFTVSDIRAEEDEIFTGPILKEDDDGRRILPRSQSERALFFKRLRSNPSFESGIFATDASGRLTDFGVIVTFARGGRVDLISREVLEICHNHPELTVIPQGSPVVNVSFNNYMQRDMKRFLPLVVLVMAITFFLNFRSPQGLFLPLISLLTSTVWIMGTMGHLGLAITPLGISLPSLMVSVGSSYAIHIYNQYLSEREGFTQSPAGFKKGLLSAMEHIAPTVLFAGLTTIIAFATLASSRLSAVREWGLLSALGVTYSMVVATTLIPSVLVLRHGSGKKGLPVKKISTKKSRHPVELAVRLFTFLATRHPGKVVFATCLLIGFCLLGVSRIEVESDFLTYFKKSDPIRTSAALIDTKFKGRWGFNLLIDTQKSGGVLEPSFLKEMERLRAELSSSERKAWSIGRTDAITDFLMIMNRAMNRDDPAFYRVPENPMDILDYFEIYGGEDENDDGRADTFEPLFDSKRRVANIVCRFTEGNGHSVGSTRMGIIMEEIESWANQTLPEPMTAHITGFPKIDVKITRFITWGQLSSLGLSLGVIFLIVLVRFRSIHGALLSLVPMGTAVVINFGVMGWFGIHLDMLTSIIASITIGIGVDDTIHFLNTYRQRTRLERLPMAEAVERTLSVSGRAITYTSLALIAGFLVLVTSNFTAVILFGCLMTLTMVATTVGALLVLPSLVLLTGFYPNPHATKEEVCSEDRTDRLIALFKRIGTPQKNKAKESTHLKEQTEETYQQEQARWLEEVKRRKQKGKSHL